MPFRLTGCQQQHANLVCISPGSEQDISTCNYSDMQIGIYMLLALSSLLDLLVSQQQHDKPTAMLVMCSADSGTTTLALLEADSCHVHDSELRKCMWTLLLC